MRGSHRDLPRAPITRVSTTRRIYLELHPAGQKKMVKKKKKKRTARARASRSERSGGAFERWPRGRDLTGMPIFFPRFGQHFGTVSTKRERIKWPQGRRRLDEGRSTGAALGAGTSAGDGIRGNDRGELQGDGGDERYGIAAPDDQVPRWASLSFSLCRGYELPRSGRGKGIN